MFTVTIATDSSKSDTMSSMKDGAGQSNFQPDKAYSFEKARRALMKKLTCDSKLPQCPNTAIPRQRTRTETVEQRSGRGSSVCMTPYLQNLSLLDVYRVAQRPVWSPYRSTMQSKAMISQRGQSRHGGDIGRDDGRLPSPLDPPWLATEVTNVVQDIISKYRSQVKPLRVRQIPSRLKLEHVFPDRQSGIFPASRLPWGPSTLTGARSSNLPLISISSADVQDYRHSALRSIGGEAVNDSTSQQETPGSVDAHNRICANILPRGNINLRNARLKVDMSQEPWLNVVSSAVTRNTQKSLDGRERGRQRKARPKSDKEDWPYVDPMDHAPLGFRLRLQVLAALESDTIRWERGNKIGKKWK
ncbi:PREDICTED: uncharacterized protein LOC106814350 isoform X2 [Priapulus caudatus]|uniref:Uncharacterized protein LOC106814350 isoform X2 n=1 Tax=Priapulus caudatus TaxID=37621 RepID=A0ABM1EPM3_PRICU|nr:PREDICTED: uncharacterized protein LOC106814350 isoform X2 [Priapulus caudatus]